MESVIYAGENKMTSNETKMILSNLENINNRLDILDSRVTEFIQQAVEIQGLKEQVKAQDIEQTRLRETVTRAHQRMDEVTKLLRDLENAPAKNTHAAVTGVKSTVLHALCGAGIAGVIGFLGALLNFLSHKGG